jgi:hypothetical protein
MKELSLDVSPLVVTLIGTCHVGKCISGIMNVTLDSVADTTLAWSLPTVTTFSDATGENPLPFTVTGCCGGEESISTQVTRGTALTETLNGAL